jgi:hypothetical protein
MPSETWWIDRLIRLPFEGGEGKYETKDLPHRCNAGPLLMVQDVGDAVISVLASQFWALWTEFRYLLAAFAEKHGVPKPLDARDEEIVRLRAEVAAVIARELV